MAGEPRPSAHVILKDPGGVFGPRVDMPCRPAFVPDVSTVVRAVPVEAVKVVPPKSDMALTIQSLSVTVVTAAVKVVVVV